MMINDKGHDGVHDHTQNCEMTGFHIDIEENDEDSFLRKRSLQGAKIKTQ